MLIYITWDGFNQTYNAMCNSECIFYSSSIDDFDSWIEKQPFIKINELEYRIENGLYWSNSAFKFAFIQDK